MKTIHRDEYKKLIEKLITARKNAGLTQQSLADELKKPQSYVSKYENCERRLDALEFIEIAKILEVDTKNIFN